MAATANCRFYLFLLLILCIAFKGSGATSCSLTAKTYKGCVPTPDTLEVSISGSGAGVKAVSYAWTFGDGTNSSQATTQIVHIYYKRGQYQPSVKIKFSDGSFITCTINAKIRIYDNPIPAFSIPVDTIRLCDTSSVYCFKDASHPGQDKAPIIKWLWDFRDGNPFDTSRSPCHAFPYSSVFKITLQVIDSNHCSNLYVKNAPVKILPRSIHTKPDFYDTVIESCSGLPASVKFINLTPTKNNYITKFIWDFGDSTYDTCYYNNSNCSPKWSNFTHKYTKTGTYCPILYITNKFNCGFDSFKNPLCFNLINYRPHPHVLDTLECFRGNFVSFFANQDPRLYAGCYWNFGDPHSLGDNYITNGWICSHRFSHPGTYTIYFSWSHGQCFYDTSFCKKVKILGPVAKIQIDTSLDRIPLRPLTYIPPSQYLSFFDTCHAPIIYTLMDSTFIKNGDTLFGSYCKAKIKYGHTTDFGYSCDKKIAYDSFAIYQRPIKALKDTIVYTYYDTIWRKGDPFPSPGKVYKGTHFVNRPLVWDDTDIFSLHCGPPKLIHFTNFSVKYRGHDAGDNFPPGSADPCRLDYNPVYPYSSDSLTYFWDFQEGSTDTSTPGKPNRRSRFSTEKLPWHLFLDTGCFHVQLYVRDTVTHCGDMTNIDIVLEKPSAKWDAVYDTVKKMDYNKQVELGSKSALRRGFILYGSPCHNINQTIDMSETLPLCLKREYALVLDSLHETWTDSCSGKADTFHTWSRNMYGSFMYADTGWKSIGVAITSNPYCYDTFWYHNYKYIFQLSPKIKPNTTHLCPQTRLKLWLQNPTQQGIKLLTLNYRYAYGRDTLTDLGTDTFRHQYIINNLGQRDTVTSTTSNPLFEIVDTAHFNYLSDTITKVFGRPGHFYVYSVISNRFGCQDSTVLDLAIGHYANFNVSNRNVCIGDSVRFSASVMYNQATTYDSLLLNPQRGYNFKPYWRDPIGVRGGRHPKYAERFKWDLNGDGIIDDSTNYSPVFVYTKPGNYTVKLYTRDSLDCDWQVVEKKLFIKAIGIHAGFSIAAPGPDRFCNPQIFHFKSSSYIADSAIAGRAAEKIKKYVWNFGDGNLSVVTNKDSIGYIITHNGTYPITLTVYSSDSVGISRKGCTATDSLKVFLDGPLPKFKIVGDTAGCVPFTLKVVDLSKKTTFKDWRLGDGTLVSTTKQDTVLLTYNTVGVFCPRLVGASQVTDTNNITHYCSDTFPYKQCQFQVRVLPRPKTGFILSDSVICVNEPFHLDDKSDTAFKKWYVDFGNGHSQSVNSTPHLIYSYPDTGNYLLKYIGYGPPCPDSVRKKIKVVDIKAAFYLDSGQADTPAFHFINTSYNANKYTWLFGDNSLPLTVTDPAEISHLYITTGTFRVCLIASNAHGCSDSVCRTVSLGKFIFIPNVFTPGNDNKNDRYVIVARGEQLYRLEIFNRWGQPVFVSNNKSNTWDGTLFNDEHTACAAGTYYFLFHYQLLGEPEKTVEGTVTLIR